MIRRARNVLIRKPDPLRYVIPVTIDVLMSDRVMYTLIEHQPCEAGFFQGNYAGDPFPEEYDAIGDCRLFYRSE